MLFYCFVVLLFYCFVVLVFCCFTVFNTVKCITLSLANRCQQRLKFRPGLTTLPKIHRVPVSSTYHLHLRSSLILLAHLTLVYAIRFFPNKINCAYFVPVPWPDVTFCTPHFNKARWSAKLTKFFVNNTRSRSIKPASFILRYSTEHFSLALWRRNFL